MELLCILSCVLISLADPNFDSLVKSSENFFLFLLARPPSSGVIDAFYCLTQNGSVVFVFKILFLFLACGFVWPVNFLDMVETNRFFCCVSSRKLKNVLFEMFVYGTNLVMGATYLIAVLVVVCDLCILKIIKTDYG